MILRVHIKSGYDSRDDVMCTHKSGYDSRNDVSVTQITTQLAFDSLQ